MMATRNRLDIAAEMSAIRGFLDELPEADVVTRFTLSTRMEELEAELSTATNSADEIIIGSVDVLFDGPPVTGSRGIDAEFGSQAILAFTELASRLQTGRRAKRRFNLVGNVAGSFGFRLEEVPEETTEGGALGESVLEQAVNLVSAAHVSDSTFDEAMADVGSRALTSLRDFLEHVSGSDAVLKMNSQAAGQIRLEPADVRRAGQRVRGVEVVEETELSWTGRLLGILPAQRRFEFESADDLRVISGRVSEDIPTDTLKAISRKFTGQNCVARMSHRVVRRSTRSSDNYTLFAITGEQD